MQHIEKCDKLCTNSDIKLRICKINSYCLGCLIIVHINYLCEQTFSHLMDKNAVGELLHIKKTL